MKVTYTEETVADIVEAITYLNERNPTAAAKLDADIAGCIQASTTEARMRFVSAQRMDSSRYFRRCGSDIGLHGLSRAVTNGEGGNQTEIPAAVEVGDGLTSQSRHSLVCRDRRLPVNC